MEICSKMFRRGKTMVSASKEHSNLDINIDYVKYGPRKLSKCRGSKLIKQRRDRLALKSRKLTFPACAFKLLATPRREQTTADLVAIPP